jgi:hypothetical protein
MFLSAARSVALVSSMSCGSVVSQFVDLLFASTALQRWRWSGRRGLLKVGSGSERKGYDEGKTDEKF